MDLSLIRFISQKAIAIVIYFKEVMFGPSKQRKNDSVKDYTTSMLLL